MGIFVKSTIDSHLIDNKGMYLITQHQILEILKFGLPYDWEDCAQCNTQPR